MVGQGKARTAAAVEAVGEAMADSKTQNPTGLRMALSPLIRQGPPALKKPMPRQSPRMHVARDEVKPGQRAKQHPVELLIPFPSKLRSPYHPVRNHQRVRHQVDASSLAVNSRATMANLHRQVQPGLGKSKSPRVLQL